MVLPLPCLRPCLLPQACASAATTSAYLQFYKATQKEIGRKIRNTRCNSSVAAANSDTFDTLKGNAIQASTIDTKTSTNEWPRLTKESNILDIKDFRYRYGNIKRGELVFVEHASIRGRIWSVRRASEKLVFLDIVQDRAILQCMCNIKRLKLGDFDLEKKFKEFPTNLHRGDIISVSGSPHRTMRNELTIVAIELPQLLSKCRKQLPENLKNEETKMRKRHVHLLTDQRPGDFLRLRSEILKCLRQHLSAEGFVDVQTPILADAAGGAVARPFHTSATEFSDRQLALRIAPELWLKRLIVGGFEKIYEIGPSFRNEGIDLNHNPEFWTCEFYKTYADLDELIAMTEKIFYLLAKTAKDAIYANLPSLDGYTEDCAPPFRQIDFIPTIEKTLQLQLPDLSSTDAESRLADILRNSGVRMPSSPTLPSLLDRLSSTYLEPQCTSPTWIINHPECLSPLSKSFFHPFNGQRVAARAELFVQKQELVNTYEEENSPIEQRRKFEMQLRFKNTENPAEVDEGYLEVLEWGMPPTGGWGCGIDRLCMLFAGTNRIADTLAFGTLRNVVGKSQSNVLKT